MSKQRNFIFTHNNYVDTVLEDTIECRYIAYGKEVAPTTGTPHLQGFVCFKNATTLKSVIKKLPGCHVEVMHGSMDQNVHYCNKDGLFVERGDKPISNDNKGRAEKLRWQRARELAISNDMEQIDADIYIRQYNTLKRIASDHQPKPVPLETSRPGLWIHGPTRTGKSHSVHSAFPNAYLKNNDKWWDGYNGEDVVYLEDLDKYDVKLGGLLKRWVDKWPFACEVKGGRQMIRPKKVIVTSNYKIEDIWDDEVTRNCLNGRFTVIFKETREQQLFLL